jgi:hypothetical protein
MIQEADSIFEGTLLGALPSMKLKPVIDDHRVIIAISAAALQLLSFY